MRRHSISLPDSFMFILLFYFSFISFFFVKFSSHPSRRFHVPRLPQQKDVCLRFSKDARSSLIPLRAKHFLVTPSLRPVSQGFPVCDSHVLYLRSRPLQAFTITIYACSHSSLTELRMCYSSPSLMDWMLPDKAGDETRNKLWISFYVSIKVY